MDLAMLIGHSSGLRPLGETDAVWADLNHDGFVNAADQDELVKEILQTRTPEALPLATVRRISPANGESNVAVTRETVLDFTIPLSLGAVVDTSKLWAEFAGKKILCRTELSSDRRKASLFFLEPLPSSARITVKFDPT